MYPINVNTGAVGAALNPTYTGNSPSAANATGYNTVNGKFYYFKRNYPSSPQEFVSFDPVANSYSILASSPVTANVNSGCVNFDGSGYYCLDQNANLCYYDIASNTWSLITSVFYDAGSNNITSNFTSYSSGDMAIDGLGNLWIVCSGSSKYGVFKVSAPLPKTTVASLTATQIVGITSTPGGSNFAGIAFSASGQIYMSMSSGNNKLYRLENNLTLTYLTTFTTDGVGADLTSCNYPFGILPVTWNNFTASLENNQSVTLSWQVSNEVNNKGYYVQRSVDGNSWAQIGFVPNDGTAQLSKLYTYSDNNPQNGLNFYRIEEADLNGTEKYSSIKSVTLDNSAITKTSVWPNPARSAVYIQTDANDNNIKMQIIDPFGKLIATNTLHSGKNEINISNLPAGTYIIHTQKTDGETQNQKIVKL
ncbi:MAG: T9SS type A sorting domain-containing protein [Bacteroidetes bacterium]|nr:T9SS type A sorting domain-containing protein [Bacteroidota bacterium]